MSLVKKIFDYFVWLLFFWLLLLGGVFYIADRTYPGDYLYPFKLKFETFELATSKILNNQVDFSIELVSKRSNEAAKVLDSRYAKDGLEGLNTQVKLTTASISQMPDPVEKKRAAEKYIVKLNEASSVLSERQKKLVVASTSSNITPQVNVTTKPTEQVSQNQTPTTSPLSEISTVSQQIDNTQETIQQAIDKMTDLTTNNNITPMENENDQEEEKNNGKSNNEKGNQREKQNNQRDQ